MLKHVVVRAPAFSELRDIGLSVFFILADLMPFFLHDGRLQHFAHVPKCGGTSIEQALEARLGPLAFFDGRHFTRHLSERFTSCSPQHATAEATEVCIPRHFRGASFALVRHPLSRFVSAYHHAQRRGRLPAMVSPEAWLIHYRKIQHLRPCWYDNHLRPATEFLFPDTKVFRLEDGMRPVCDWIYSTYGIKLDVNREPLNIHTTNKNTVAKCITPKLRDIVHRHFQRDYETFDYDPDALQELNVTRYRLCDMTRYDALCVLSYNLNVLRFRLVCSYRNMRI